MFAALPPDAAVFTYWASSPPLWHATMVEGLRPDLLIVDDTNIVYEGWGTREKRIDSVICDRPVYVMRPNDSELAPTRAAYGLTEAFTVFVGRGSPSASQTVPVYRVVPPGRARRRTPRRARAPIRGVEFAHGEVGRMVFVGTGRQPDSASGMAAKLGAADQVGPRDPNDIGVVFVHGVGSQKPGEWLLEASRPLLRLLSAWRTTTDGVDPANDPTRIANIDFSGGSRPFIVADVPAIGDHPAQTWHLTEAWWAARVSPPSVAQMFRWLVPWELKRLFAGSCQGSGPRAASSSSSTSCSCPCS